MELTINDKHPTIIFKEEQSHEVAALILIANFTQNVFEQVLVTKYDHAHYDYIVDAGTVYNQFEILHPFKYLVVDSLSSFDLEYTCNYTIQFKEKGYGNIIKLQFALEKYGRLDGSKEEMFFEEIDIRGKIIKTKVSNT